MILAAAYAGPLGVSGPYNKLSYVFKFARVGFRGKVSSFEIFNTLLLVNVSVYGKMVHRFDVNMGALWFQ